MKKMKIFFIVTKVVCFSLQKGTQCAKMPGKISRRIADE